jgi:diguanylate cyclase (GGDEF)-like protein
MALPNINGGALYRITRQLEQAIYNHEQWAEAINTTLICHLIPDERDLAGDAHRRCRFGQWYHEAGLPILERHAGFEAIGIEHERMHQYATKLLRSSTVDEKITITNYEHFLTTRKRLILEIQTLQQELGEELNNVDPLTGTTNRIGMLTRLREQQELVKRKVHSCVVGMMDLDNFKAINDKYGHITGDKVLISIARRIMANLRPYDKIFRYGGEEFLISLPDTDLKTGYGIVDRMRDDLASILHEGSGNATFHVAVTFGLTLLAPDTTVEQSIDRADKALYAAKKMGKNRVVVWDESVDAM